MQIPPESKTIACKIGHAAAIGVRWKDTVRTVARPRTPHGQMRVRGTSVVSRVGPLTDRTKAQNKMDFRVKCSEYILIANGEAITARTIWRRLVPETLANPCHGTDLDTSKKRQFDPLESGVDATTNLTKHPFQSRLLKQDRRKSVYLKQCVLDAHGLTQGCPRCGAMREGIRAQGTSLVCRARTEELL